MNAADPGYVPATYEGSAWRLLRSVPTAGELPADWSDGYWRTDGVVHVLTRHLTLFALVQDQTPPGAPTDLNGTVERRPLHPSLDTVPAAGQDDRELRALRRRPADQQPRRDRAPVRGRHVRSQRLARLLDRRDRHARQPERAQRGRQDRAAARRALAERRAQRAERQGLRRRRRHRRRLVAAGRHHRRPHASRHRAGRLGYAAAGLGRAGSVGDEVRLRRDRDEAPRAHAAVLHRRAPLLDPR